MTGSVDTPRDETLRGTRKHCGVDTPHTAHEWGSVGTQAYVCAGTTPRDETHEAREAVTAWQDGNHIATCRSAGQPASGPCLECEAEFVAYLDAAVAKADKLTEALQRMADEHPFVMDGDNGAMVASWFVHEARAALAAARTAVDGTEP